MYSYEQLSGLASHYFGPRGAWAYAAFADINARFFAGRLPTPLIYWAITPHSACIGQTVVHVGGPAIMLHPALLGGSETERPWNKDPTLLGYGYAYETLLHECMHVNISYVLDPARAEAGSSSHNSDPWIREVNRIAPMLGLGALRAGRSKVRRERTEEGSRVVRGVDDGVAPFKATSKFPHSYREILGELDFYRSHRSRASFGFVAEPSASPT